MNFSRTHVASLKKASGSFPRVIADPSHGIQYGTKGGAPCFLAFEKCNTARTESNAREMVTGLGPARSRMDDIGRGCREDGKSQAEKCSQTLGIDALTTRYWTSHQSFPYKHLAKTSRAWVTATTSVSPWSQTEHQTRIPFRLINSPAHTTRR